MAKNIDFYTLLRLTQEYISQHYAAALTDKAKLPQLKAYIDKYLRDNDYRVDGIETGQLIDLLYREMAEYSILTPYLGSAYWLPPLGEEIQYQTDGADSELSPGTWSDGL